MNKKIINVISIFFGVLIGCFVGIKGELSGWDFFKETIWGVLVFYSLVDAFLENQDKYAISIGVIASLLIVILLDLIAGSPIVVIDKLGYLFVGSFIGWGSGWGKAYWIPVLVGGLIGGIFGFVLGMNGSQWFGKVCLVPGLLNATLTFVKWFIVGMGAGSLYLKSFGWHRIRNKIHVD